MRMTNRQLDWWTHQAPIQTCAICDKSGSKSNVQPQYPHPKKPRPYDGRALCVDCISDLNRDHDKRRKVQLAAAPRCEVDGCNRRGTSRYGWGADRALLCGIHGTKARREFTKGGGPFWAPAPALSAAQIIVLASVKQVPA